MLQILLYALRVSFVLSPGCTRQRVQILLMFSNFAWAGLREIKCEHNLDGAMVEDISHMTFEGPPNLFLSSLRKQRQSLTAPILWILPPQVSLAASVQPGEPRLHPLRVSFDLKINHVRKPAKSRASVLLTQVTAEMWGLGRQMWQQLHGSQQSQGGCAVEVAAALLPD